MPAALGTARLALRRRELDDAAWSLDLLGERDGGPTLTLDDVRARLTAQAADVERHGFGFDAIRVRPAVDDADPNGQARDGSTDGVERDPIGCCGLLVGRSTIDEPEIAYELFRRAHGNGDATEAARVVLDAAFASGRQRIWATVRTGNVASLRVLDEVGFTRRRTTIGDGAELVWLVAEP